jgi:hypothetical protein
MRILNQTKWVASLPEFKKEKKTASISVESGTQYGHSYVAFS